jgi:hypothetical protein
MGLLDQGPGYTVSDLVYWMGLMLGASAAYVVFFHVFEWQMNGILRLILVLGVGVGCGFVCDLIYRNATRNRPPRNDL